MSGKGRQESGGSNLEAGAESPAANGVHKECVSIMCSPLAQALTSGLICCLDLCSSFL